MHSQRVILDKIMNLANTDILSLWTEHTYMGRFRRLIHSPKIVLKKNISILTLMFSQNIAAPWQNTSTTLKVGSN